MIVDIVPNHTSNRHPWFVEALAARRGASERDRYLFRDGAGPRGELPPNDWESLFGGSAWASVGDGQWYFHCFAAEQPDLNWESEEVRDDFRRTVGFWADRGADGFRIDVAHGLRKDMSEPYPPWGEIADLMRPDGSHPLWDRDDVHEIYADWRRILNSYDPPRYAVAEAAVHPARRALYASADSLGNAFNFDDAGRGLAGRRLSPRDQQRASRHDQQRLDHELAAGLPRHAKGGDPIRAAARKGASRTAGRPGMAAHRRCNAPAGSGSGSAAGAGGDHDLAGTAGLNLHLPGRGARPTRGR